MSTRLHFGPSMTNRPDEQEQGDVATETRREVKRPPLYKVLLHNDDYTTQDFVVFILRSIFHHPPEQAHQIMMHVHTRGIGVAGLYPFETAEAKVEQVHGLARDNEYPLKCSIEPE
jgi:ATP-dependent Clp protease adaptor protein ClpS